MARQYDEYDNNVALNTHLKYWCNACGELHHHGEYDIDDVSELPKELQRAYQELWQEGQGCLEYLVEYKGAYYVALVCEFDESFAGDINFTMDELYDAGKTNALQLYNEDMFQNTMLVIGKHTGCNECHEFIFLVPAMETKSVYDAIEDSLYQRIWEVSK